MRPTRRERLARVACQVATCPLCRELVENRTAPVFGEGKLAAKALFVGEAPGRQEDEQGRPFVGQAGKLLDELFDEAGLARSDVFLTNIIKCHPPQNRTPHKSEIANCLPYLQEQIALVRPRVICSLGGVAACALIGTNEPFERLTAKCTSMKAPGSSARIIQPTCAVCRLCEAAQLLICGVSASGLTQSVE